MQVNQGLENIIAAETALSHVDGQAGELIIAGWPLNELVKHFDYSRCAIVLWQSWMPNVNGPELQTKLGQARLNSFRKLQPFQAQLTSVTALEALRLGLDLDAEASDPASICSALMVSLALHLGRPVEPDPQAEPITDLLRLCQAGASLDVDPAYVRALTRYLVSVSDHGLNASTFTARVIASTGSDLRSCIAGALGALKGPLHGGAPGPVLDMLDQIGEAQNTNHWIEAELAAKRRIMGFGHRVYRVRDPRADVLKETLFQLKVCHALPALERAQQIEQEILAILRAHKPDRVLETNVEFYTALLLDALGFPRDRFTAVFAVGRVLGWIGHVYEQQATGRLIRPQSRYIGPLP